MEHIHRALVNSNPFVSSCKKCGAMLYKQKRCLDCKKIFCTVCVPVWDKWSDFSGKLEKYVEGK